MKKVIKILTPTISSILPIAAVVSCGKSVNDSKNKFDAISYKGKSFGSQRELVKWIKSNAIAEKIAANSRQFSIKGDQNKVIYTNKDDALFDIMNKHLKQVNIYLNKDSSLKNVIDPITGEINKDNFLVKEKSLAYTAFKVNAQTQYEIIDENGDSKFIKGSKYIYAKNPENILLKNDGSDETELKAEKQRLQKVWNKTRDQAALSFIQVHNAFIFNGKFYANKATLANELNKMEDGAIASIFGDSIKTDSKQITLANGSSRIIDGDTIKDPVLLEKYIKDNILGLVEKGFGTNENDFIKAINANQANIESIVTMNNFLDFIQVNPNQDVPMYIVDMAKTNSKGKPSQGNFYGDYFASTPLGTSGITDKTDDGELTNWHKISNPKINSGYEDVAMQELKSIINYLLIIKGYSSPLSFFANATIANEAKIARANGIKPKTFTQFLQSLVINKQNSQDANYLNMLVSFIQNLQNGVNYNFLDTLNASYSYLIDNMIKYGEKNEDIIKVAKYFQSVLESIDSLAYQMIYPFLAKADSGYITEDLLNGEEVKLNYFASTMSFYDQDKKSSGIDFQRHPLSIYRHLIGDTQNLTSKMRQLMNLNEDESYRNKMVFQLLRSAMGAQGLKLNAIRHNQQVYQRWLKGTNPVDLATSWTNLEKDKKDESFTSFEFEGHKVLISEKKDSKEYQSIWQHVSNEQGNLPNTFSLNNKTYSLSTIQENINDYLLESNKKFRYSKNLINDNIKLITDDILDSGFNSIRNKIEEEIILSLGQDIKTYNRNTKEFIDMVKAKKNEYSWKDFWKDNSSRSLKQRHLSKKEKSPLILFGENVNAVNNSQSLVITSEYMHNLNVINNQIVTPLEDRLKNLATFIGTTVIKAANSFASISSSFNKAAQNYTKVSSSTNSSQQAITKAYLDMVKANSDYNKRGTKVAAQINSDIVSQHDFGTNFWNDDAYSAPVDVFDEYTGLQMAAINMLNKMGDKNYKWSLKDLGSGFSDLLQLDELGLPGKILQGAVDVTMNIITNVIPFISNIFGFINSFSSSETIYYTYASSKQDISYIWDGVKKETSWWGLSQSVKGNINDLNLIEPIEIISGRTTSKSGIYYNGKFYLDTNEPVANFTKELIDYVQTIDPKKHEGTQVSSSGIFANIPLAWKMSFRDSKDKITSIVSDSVENLVESIADRIKNNIGNISASLFQVGSTLVTSSIDAKQKWIQNIVDHLQPATIFQMPNYDTRGYPEVNSIFDPVNSGIDNPNYVIFNPNRTNSDLIADNQDKFKEIIDQTKDNLANTEWIKDTALEIATEIPVDTKKVLFTQIINDEHGLFKELDKTYIEDPIAIYKTYDIFGKEKYFDSRKNAMNFLVSDRNYKIKTNTLNLESVFYRFENQFFATYNDIYEYIIANSTKVKGGKNE